MRLFRRLLRKLPGGAPYAAADEREAVLAYLGRQDTRELIFDLLQVAGLTHLEPEHATRRDGICGVLLDSLAKEIHEGRHLR